jgi:Cu-Zn family superoxide dismutase
MRRFTKLNVSLFIGTLVVFGAGAVLALANAPNSATPDGPALRATAELVGAPGSGISGEVRFVQTEVVENHPEPGVWVVARVEGLTPGRHGFHIHENGVCEPPAFVAAGGHYDPGPFGNSTPVDANHPYHMGDLPNLEANEAGVGHLNVETSRVTLSPGPLTLFDANGSAVIVHLNPDLGLTGVLGASGGPRVACGVIVPEE